MHKIVIIIIISLLCANCSYMLDKFIGYELITEIPVDLKKKYSFSKKLDLRTHKRVRDNGKTGPYQLLISCDNFEEKNVWAKLDETYNNTGKYFLGEVELTIVYPTGDIEVVVSTVTFGRRYGIYLKSFWLPATKEKTILNVTIEVLEVDSVLADILETPKLIIDRGGDL